MTHIKAYTREDGTFVHEHEDTRAKAPWWVKILDRVKNPPSNPAHSLHGRPTPFYPKAKAHPELNDHGKPVSIHQPHEETPEITWAEKTATATWTPGSPTPKALNGVAFAPWTPPADERGWAEVEGQRHLHEPPMPIPEPILTPKGSFGKGVAAGVIIEEPDGRIWVIHPTNEFGGYKCVPQEDSEILTKEGWKRHDEVKVGDETLGFDPIIGGTRWTKIEEIHHYDEAPMIWFGSKKWGVRCTPNHRWLVYGHPDGGTKRCWQRRKEQRLGDTRYAIGDAAIDGIASSRQLVVSAPRMDEPKRTITGREAAIIGWIVTDGTIQRSRHGNKVTAVIAQGKKCGIEALDRLLRGTQHTKSDYRSFNGCYQYRISSAAFNGLLEKTGWDGTKTSLPALVLRMDNIGLQYFMDACWMAEGDQSRKGRLWQNEGPVLDAMAMAGFMLGNSITITGKKKCKALALNRPMLRDKSVVVKLAGSAPAWCVTTELGTWTMRQRGIITLTGNSTFPKGHQEPGMSLQATAIKEAFEESGLKVEITGFAGDVERSTTTCRYYTARRTGGTPAKMGWETQAVSLVPRSKLYGVLNRPVDHDMAEAMGAGPRPAPPPLPPMKHWGPDKGEKPSGGYPWAKKEPEPLTPTPWWDEL